MCSSNMCEAHVNLVWTSHAIEIEPIDKGLPLPISHQSSMSLHIRQLISYRKPLKDFTLTRNWAIDYCSAIAGLELEN
jgi:hypothetical protein